MEWRVISLSQEEFGPTHDGRPLGTFTGDRDMEGCYPTKVG